MRRFFAERERCRGQTIELDEAESQHLAQVLRTQTGERVTVLDGAGGIFECAVEKIAKRHVTLTILDRQRAAPLPYDLTLFQAIPKGKIMDGIVQKATELGARRIVPLLTERTIVDIDADSAKVDKWRDVAIESIKQCGSPWLPKIDRPIKFNEALKQVGSFALVASLHAGAKEIDQFFKVQRPSEIQIWVGPEGDFTPAEVDALVSAGAHPITLGPLVLRCDTAAVCSLALAAHWRRRSLRNPEA